MPEPLDIYDNLPKAMNLYRSHYGWNFNKKACEEAVKGMRRRNPTTGEKESFEPMTKEKVDELLSKYGIKLEHNVGYNYVYVANQGYADFFKSSVPDEQHLALYVKNVIDDPDNEGGNVLRKWYADRVKKGMPVEWYDLL